MLDDLVARWATLLVDYCLRVEPGETILIASELEARPLVEACFREVVRRGAHPDRPRRAARAWPSSSSSTRTKPNWPTSRRSRSARRRWPTAGSGSRPRPTPARCEASTRSGRRSSTGPAPRSASWPSKKRWVLTQYPTAAYAADAGMAMADYEAYVASAMFLDRDDPVAAWQALGRRQAGLVEFMSGVSEVRIEGDGTDITLSVAGRTWINSDGRRNMPSGEIFTGPVEDQRPRASSGAASPSAEGAASWSGSPWNSRRARSSRPGPTRGKSTCSRCSTSTPAPVASASWGSA